MLQKILFDSSKTKTHDKQSYLQSKPNTSLKYNTYSFSKKLLYHKYSQFEYSFSLFCTNNLVFNERCRIVARFKDFLVLDDSTEFLRRFYSKKELKARLKKIFNFYESYCKIFPNYMILPESQFLYRNIRKKQKMIDAFNEIKKEEEENRKHLKLGLVDENMKNKERNMVFTKNIQESIDRYHPSVSNLLSNTFMNEMNNNINNEINYDKSVTVSLNSQRPLNILEFDKYFTPNKNSFLENDRNINDNTINSQNSIFKIVQILNNNIQDSNIDTFNDKNNINSYNKINKIECKNNISPATSNKIIKKINNTNNKNTKNNAKKILTENNNNFNTLNSSSNKNIKINMNKISNINNNSNPKKNKKDNNNNNNINTSNNTTNKRKFISHKQTVSVPLASNILNNNDNNIFGEKNTIKIINNINNIIINDDKNKTINNGMIININNNYFQLKNTKRLNNKIIKRVKSKEDQKKEKSKDKKNQEKTEKDENYTNFQIFREKRTYTSYNMQNKAKKNKKLLMNAIPSPNKKKENNNNNQLLDKKNYKNINSNTYYLSINNTNKQNNIYRNANDARGNGNKKINKKLIESKTINTNSNTISTTINNHTNIYPNNVTEINNNYKNIFGNKLKISMNKNKEKPKLDGLNSIDNKKMSINRTMVNNYLTTTQKKKTYQGRFIDHESSSLNTHNNITNTKNKKINDKIEVLNIYNTIQNKNNANTNPIKFKLNKKSMIRKTKINSMQINNKNEFLSSFNLTKEKIPGTNIELDIINLEDNIAKYKKKSIKKFMNNKTQSNSEAELIQDNNKNFLNTFTSKSLKKDKTKNNNDKKETNIANLTSNEMKKINVKEMKEKYHKLLRGNKFTHGSYDTTNRLHLLKKFRGLNNIVGNVTNNINNTISSNKNKRSFLTKKSVLSPGLRIQNTVGNYIKTPIKNQLNINNKEVSVASHNNALGGNKLNIIGKKNKQTDTNNKKMKFIKK